MEKKIKVWIEKRKKPIIIIGSIFIIMIVTFLIGRSLADPNSGYLRNQSVDGLSFENAELVYENGITTFTAEVYNESGDVYSLKNISIQLTDEADKVTTLVGYIGDSLDEEEGTYLKASIDQDLSDIVSLEYVINK